MGKRCQGHGLWGAKCRQGASHRLTWASERKGKPFSFSAVTCTYHADLYALNHPGEATIDLLPPIKEKE